MERSILPQKISLIDFPYTVGLVIDKLDEITTAVHLHNRFHFYFVGGIVRDAYLQRATSKTDIDVAFSGEHALLIGILERSDMCTVLQRNDQLHTARVAFFDSSTRATVECDLAQLRAEDYVPGNRYPQVTFNNIPIQWDLARRDFTINALAFDTKTGEVIDPFGGYRDLQKGYIRVLHELSFKDDPTRIDRAKEFAQRLGFTIEPSTAQLMEDAHA